MSKNNDDRSFCEECQEGSWATSSTDEMEGTPTRGAQTTTTTIPFLIAYDFDHTIVECNSDTVIQDIHHESPIPERVRIVAKHLGWTTFMQEVFRFHYAHHVTKQMFCDTLDSMALVEGVLESMHAAKSLGAELIVISDANTFFISRVLEHHGVLEKFSEIISNPAWFNVNGRLSIAPYHNNAECRLSSRNLCKGRVMEEYIARRKEEGVDFAFTAFCGDGVNDFCPMLRLKEHDLALPRFGFGIGPYIERMKKEDNLIIKANLVYWSEGKGIIAAFSDHLKETDSGKCEVMALIQ